MFAFNPFIGVLARSFNLFQKIFPGGLTGREAPAADDRLSGYQEKTLAPRFLLAAGNARTNVSGRSKEADPSAP